MLLEEIKKEEFKAGLEQGIKRGLEQGREQGLEQGLEQGHQQGMVDLASAIQNLQAGKKPEDLIKDGVSEETVKLAQSLK